MAPYSGFIEYIEQHAGWSVEVYIKGEEEPWDLHRIEVIIEIPSAVFIGGTLYGQKHRPLINLDTVSCLIFCYPEGDDKDRHDIPEPEKKTLMSVTSIAVNQ